METAKTFDRTAVELLDFAPNDRFRYGVRKPEECKSLGRRSTSYHEVMEGPLKGLRCHGTPNAKGEFDVTGYLPQIGLAQTDAGPFEFYLFDDLPTKDELTARGFVPPVHFQVYGATVEQGMAQLVKKGCPRGESGAGKAACHRLSEIPIRRREDSVCSQTD